MFRFDQLRQLATQVDSLASLEVPVVHGIHSLLVRATGVTASANVQSLLAPALSLSLALSCTQARRLDVGRPCSARAALPLAWQSSAALRIHRSALLSLPSTQVRRSLILQLVPQEPAESASAARAPCPRLAVRPPVLR